MSTSLAIGIAAGASIAAAGASSHGCSGPMTPTDAAIGAITLGAFLFFPLIGAGIAKLRGCDGISGGFAGLFAWFICLFLSVILALTGTAMGWWA